MSQYRFLFLFFAGFLLSLVAFCCLETTVMPFETSQRKGILSQVWRSLAEKVWKVHWSWENERRSRTLGASTDLRGTSPSVETCTSFLSATWFSGCSFGFEYMESNQAHPSSSSSVKHSVVFIFLMLQKYLVDPHLQNYYFKVFQQTIISFSSKY